MDEKDLEFLEDLLLFKNIEATSLANMMECFKPRFINYAKNDYITTGGEKMEGIGVFLWGKGIVTKEDYDGGRMIVDFLEAGDMFGEIAVFAGKNKWPATIICQEKARVVLLQTNKLIHCCEQCCFDHGQIIENLLAIVAGKAMMLNKKLEYLSLKNLRCKLSRYLLDIKKEQKKETIHLPMNRHQLADFLNVSRPSLSREMSKMKQEGLIEFQKAQVKILNNEALIWAAKEG